MIHVCWPLRVCALRLRNVKRWVEAESEDKKKQPFDFTGWDVMAQEDCPQQHNGFDCGVRSASRLRCSFSARLHECRR